MFSTLAMVTLNGELPRDEAARFLRVCYSELLPQDECYVWEGWQEAVAWLGLAEFKPLVQEAFDRGFISPTWTDIHFFEEDLRAALDDPAALLQQDDGRYTLFGDTIDEMSWWYCFNRDRDNNHVRKVLGAPLQKSTAPASNPHRRIGRNDPCPCGSGKKFKKCCLTAAA